jgi:hypothetical protein
MESYVRDAPVPEPSPARHEQILAREGQIAMSTAAPPDREDPRFFVADRRSDVTYTVLFAGEGIQTVETALGIARDLGERSTISSSSTIADIREGAALCEEMSAYCDRRGPPHVAISH